MASTVVTWWIVVFLRSITLYKVTIILQDCVIKRVKYDLELQLQLYNMKMSPLKSSHYSLASLNVLKGHSYSAKIHKASKKF